MINYMNDFFYLKTGFIIGYFVNEYKNVIKGYSKPIVFKGYKYYVITN